MNDVTFIGVGGLYIGYVNVTTKQCISAWGVD